MTRVLHVAQPVDGGVARYVLAATADQAARGWDVTVACPDGGWLAPELAVRRTPRVAWAATREPGPGTAGEARRLARLVRDAAPDVVHLHSAKAGLAGRLALRGRVPTLFQPHGWSWLAATGPVRAAALAWERAGARWADAVVCVGDGEAEQGRAAGVTGGLVVVRNGVDLDRFGPASAADRGAARRALGLAETPLVVCPGRVTRQKGQDLLLAGWPSVRRGCPGAALALVGDGELAGVAADPTAGVVRVPAVDDVRPWLAAADVVVLPSRWEGLSLAVLEAMATARPVVVADVPGLAEAVAPGTGAVVDAADPGALATALLHRLTDPARAAAEGAAAARHAAAGFDSAVTLDRLAAVTARVAVRSTAPQEVLP